MVGSLFHRPTRRPKEVELPAPPAASPPTNVKRLVKTQTVCHHPHITSQALYSPKTPPPRNLFAYLRGGSGSGAIRIVVVGRVAHRRRPTRRGTVGIVEIRHITHCRCPPCRRAVGIVEIRRSARRAAPSSRVRPPVLRLKSPLRLRHVRTHGDGSHNH